MAEEKKSRTADMDIEEDFDVEEEEEQTRDTLLDLAEWKFWLTLPNDTVPPQEKKQLRHDIFETIKKHSMVPFYKHMCATFDDWKEDQKLIDEMTAANETELKGYDSKIEDAKQNLGDSEVRDALEEKAKFYSRIGEKELALEAFEETLKKSICLSFKLDVAFAVLRLSLFHGDVDMFREWITKTKEMVEAGGDWERRNLLKVYEAVYCIQTREFKKAAVLLLDSVQTFTCYELCSFNTFIFYIVLTSTVTLDRLTMTKKVIKSPEILSVYRDIPNLEDFTTSLHKCRYAQFLRSLSEMYNQIRRDRFFAPHFNYLLREVRVVAYQQFLQAYRSVTLSNMANQFGYSVRFLDGELSKFITSGRLNAKIDKVNGIVETNQPDAKNRQYLAVLKQGDALLNRIQKLMKVLTV